jgi:hypothetical protein
MVTLGAIFSGSYLATRGGEKKKEQGPPINASSKEEENFIQYVYLDISCILHDFSSFQGSEIQFLFH